MSLIRIPTSCGCFLDQPTSANKKPQGLAASSLAKALLVCNAISSLAELFQKTKAHAERAAIRDFSIPVFGHLLGMHAMGHAGGFDALGIKTSDGDFVHHGETLQNVGTKDTLTIPMLDIPHLESISPSALFCAP